MPLGSACSPSLSVKHRDAIGLSAATIAFLFEVLAPCHIARSDSGAKASPDHVDWSAHFPFFFECPQDRLQLNTAENPIECFGFDPMPYSQLAVVAKVN